MSLKHIPVNLNLKKWKIITVHIIKTGKLKVSCLPDILIVRQVAHTASLSSSTYQIRGSVCPTIIPDMAVKRKIPLLLPRFQP
jgi:hypothetical protein